MIRRLARLAVLATALPTVLIAFAYASGDLDTWWIELLRYVPFPVYLVPVALAAVLSFWLRWLWRLLAIGSVALVLTVIMGLAVGRADTGVYPLRLMTYNVKAYYADSAFQKIANEVAQHDPDVLVMQDAQQLRLERARREGVAASLYAGRYAYEHGQYVVLSRYPLRDCEVRVLPYRDKSTEYASCVLTVQGIDVDLRTAHLLSPRRGLNATRWELADGVDDWQQNFADRLQQAREIALDLSRRASRPTILAGDLNASEASPVVRTLLAVGLRDAFSIAGLGYGYTHGHALKPGFSFLRIDHVLVSPEIGVVTAYAGGWEASEHRPVIADLVLMRSPR